MPELLQHLLESLLEEKENIAPQTDSYATSISTINFIILDRLAPPPLLTHLHKQNTPYTLLSISEYLHIFRDQENLDKKTHHRKPNAVILTQKVAEDNHQALTSLLACTFINVPVILYTNKPTLAEAVNFIRAGIVDYWSEYSEFSAIKTSIRHVLLTDRKRKYNRKLFLEMQHRIETLTHREEQVIDLLLSTKEEMTNKKIANHLNLSPRTIEDYRSTAMEKLAIKTKNKLALVWLISQHLKLLLCTNQAN